MAKSIKLRAKAKKGTVTVKALMNHPMETGLRKNKKTGKLIPANHITEITAESAGKTVMSAVWGGAISKNPYMSFKYNGAKGDSLTLSWLDNQGKSESVTANVK